MFSSSLFDLDRIRGFLSSSSPGNPNINSSSSAPNLHEKLEKEEVPVDLSASSCHGPLPQGWEQHLDLKVRKFHLLLSLFLSIYPFLSSINQGLVVPIVVKG